MVNFGAVCRGFAKAALPAALLFLSGVYLGAAAAAAEADVTLNASELAAIATAVAATRIFFPDIGIVSPW